MCESSCVLLLINKFVIYIRGLFSTKWSSVIVNYGCVWVWYDYKLGIKILFIYFFENVNQDWLIS